MSQSVIKNFADVEISITNEGQFIAIIGKKNYTRSSLSSMEALITKMKHLKSLKVIAKDSYYFLDKFIVDDITHILKNGRLRSDRKSYPRYDDVFLYTPEVEKEFEQIHQEFISLKSRLIKLKENLTRIDATNFDKLREG
jgi:hypothetical protein